MVHVEPLLDHMSARDLARLAAPLQAEPTRYQAYYAITVDDLVDEIEEVSQWRTHTPVATDGGELVGWLIAEGDDEIGRVWWWGPVVAATHEWIDVAEQLFDAGLAALGVRFEEFEIAVDARNIAAIELAQRRGHRRDTGSVLLELDHLDDYTPGPATRIDGMSTRRDACTPRSFARLYHDAVGSGVGISRAVGDMVESICHEPTRSRPCSRVDPVRRYG